MVDISGKRLGKEGGLRINCPMWKLVRYSLNTTK
jgi:hypothetical protein